jgi:hypothetical protein
VSSLDHPATLLTRRTAQQRTHSTRVLSADRLGRGLFHQPKLGREHPHSRHRHRTDSSTHRAAEHITHARDKVRLRRVRTIIHLAFHVASLLTGSTCSICWLCPIRSPGQWFVADVRVLIDDGGVGAGWVHVAGELDIAAIRAGTARVSGRARLVVLDLREPAFIDSSGVP